MKVSRYAKGIIAGLSPVLIVVQAAITDGVITTTEWVTIGLAVAAAAGVVAVPNRPKPTEQTPAVRPYR